MGRRRSSSGRRTGGDIGAISLVVFVVIVIKVVTFVVDLVMSIPRFVWLGLALAGASVLAVRLHRIAKERRETPSADAEREALLSRLETMVVPTRNAVEVPFEDTYPVLPPADVVPATTAAVPSGEATAELPFTSPAHIEVQQVVDQSMPVTPISWPKTSTPMASAGNSFHKGTSPHAGHTQKPSWRWTPEERERLQQALDRARGVAAGTADGAREVEVQVSTPPPRNPAIPAIREVLLEHPAINGRPKKLWSPEEREQIQRALDRVRAERMRSGEQSPLSRPTPAIDGDMANDAAATAGNASRTGRGEAQPAQVTPEDGPKDLTRVSTSTAEVAIPKVTSRRRRWTDDERQRIQVALDKVWAQKGMGVPVSDHVLATSAMQTATLDSPRDATAEARHEETPLKGIPARPVEVEQALLQLRTESLKNHSTREQVTSSEARAAHPIDRLDEFQSVADEARVAQAHQQEVPSVASLPSGPEVVELFDPMGEVFQEFFTERSLPVAEGNAPSSSIGFSSEFLIPSPRRTSETLLPVAAEAKKSTLPLEIDAEAQHARQQDGGVTTTTVESKDSTPKNAEPPPRLPRLSLDGAAIALIQAESEKAAALLGAVFTEDVAPAPARPAALLTVVAALPATSKLALDVGKIASIQAEARKSDELLGGLFVNDEDNSSETMPESRSEGNSQASATELQIDGPHRELVRRLLTQATWHRAELQLIADELDLMLDGALEQVNDAFYDAFDEPLFEGDDPLEVSATAQVLLQGTGQRVVTQ